MHINLESLYGGLTLWRDGFSQNQQNEQLYGEEHFMVERWSALWRRGTNFMDKILKGGVFCRNLRYGKILTKFGSLYGGEHFMAKRSPTLWRTNFMANSNL
jgi:hypothetical protein